MWGVKEHGVLWRVLQDILLLDAFFSLSNVQMTTKTENECEVEIKSSYSYTCGLLCRCVGDKGQACSPPELQRGQVRGWSAKIAQISPLSSAAPAGPVLLCHVRATLRLLYTCCGSYSYNEIKIPQIHRRKVPLCQWILSFLSFFGF